MTEVEAQKQFEQGKAYLKEADFEKAAEAFGEVTQIRSTLYGDLDERVGAAYHMYGTALLRLFESKAGAVGDAVLEAAQDKADREAEQQESEQKESLKDSVEAGGAPSVPKEGDDEEEEEDEPDDAQIAWECLEAARVIYSKDPDKHMRQLADVYGSLGELSMEQDNYDQAIQDFMQCQKLTAMFCEEATRDMSEVYYRIGVAHHHNENDTDALVFIQKAVTSLQGALELADKASEAATSDAKAKEQAAQQVGEMEALLPEVEGLLAELKQDAGSITKRVMRETMQELGTTTAGFGGPSASSASLSSGASSGAVPVVSVRSLDDKKEPDADGPPPVKKQKL